MIKMNFDINTIVSHFWPKKLLRKVDKYVFWSARFSAYKLRNFFLKFAYYITPEGE